MDAERVVPSDLPLHRDSHRFLGPCCLCPLFIPNSQGLYVETSMAYETSGFYSGQFVAKCAQNECGYFGESIIVISDLGDSEPYKSSS